MSIWSGLETRSLFKMTPTQFVQRWEGACPGLSTRGALLQPRLDLVPHPAVKSCIRISRQWCRGFALEGRGSVDQCPAGLPGGVCVPLGGTV